MACGRQASTTTIDHVQVWWRVRYMCTGGCADVRPPHLVTPTHAVPQRVLCLCPVAPPPPWPRLELTRLHVHSPTHTRPAAQRAVCLCPLAPPVPQAELTRLHALEEEIMSTTGPEVSCSTALYCIRAASALHARVLAAGWQAVP